VGNGKSTTEARRDGERQMKVAQSALALSVLLLTRPAISQPKPPATLLQVLHCAKNDKFGLLDAGLKKDDMLKVSFTHYVESEPDAEGFFLVIYESTSKGEVLDYVREFDQGKSQFYLVNNATFSVSSKNVLSVDDALGGVWTQGHLKQRTRRALRSTTYSIPVKSLVAPFLNVGCHSYSDP
jgi:hypothetical protein